MMFSGYVMLARFPEGHPMERLPGPLMVIPIRHWENFKEAMRPVMDGVGKVKNRAEFLESIRKHYPRVAKKVDEWGDEVDIQIWRERIDAHTPIPRQDMQYSS